jgi:hypothetical protein
MRVLSWFVVACVCLVAVSGVGRADAPAAERRLAELARATPASAHALAARTALHATGPRARSADRPRHSSPPPLAVLEPGWSPPVRSPGALPSHVRGSERVFAALLRTGSARGPPLA